MIIFVSHTINDPLDGCFFFHSFYARDQIELQKNCLIEILNFITAINKHNEFWYKCAWLWIYPHNDLNKFFLTLSRTCVLIWRLCGSLSIPITHPNEAVKTILFVQFAQHLKSHKNNETNEWTENILKSNTCVNNSLSCIMFLLFEQ